MINFCLNSFHPIYQDRLRSKDHRLQSISKILNNGDVENIELDLNSRRDRYAGSDNVTATPMTPLRPANTSNASQAFYTPRTTSHRVSDADLLSTRPDQIISLTLSLSFSSSRLLIAGSCCRKCSSSSIKIERRSLAGASCTKPGSIGHNYAATLQKS